MEKITIPASLQQTTRIFLIVTENKHYYFNYYDRLLFQLSNDVLEYLMVYDPFKRAYEISMKVDQPL